MGGTASSQLGWILVSLGLLLSVGFVLGHLAEKLGLPRVAAYVLAGALFSEMLLGRLVPGKTQDWDPPLIETALGAVAFLIGGELDLKQLRRERVAVLGATFGQSAGALAVVTLGLWVYLTWEQTPSAGLVALVLGTIATATAPAATIAVVEEYRARGPLTMLLLGVVAVDDALGIILFTLVLGLAGEQMFVASLGQAGWELLFAILVGAVLGGTLGWFGKRVGSEDLRLPVIVGSVLLLVGIANLWHFSSLLSCMMLGMVSKRLFGGKTEQWLGPMEHIQEVVFLTLFTLAGTHFELNVFVSSLPLIAVYTIARVVGKYGGAWLGVHWTDAEPPVRRYLGLALLPQAGVSIGLALIAARAAPLKDAADLIVNTILGTTVLFEFTAPLLTKMALTWAGERHA